MQQSFGTCTNCGEEVAAPKFQCPTGEQHIVVSKRYFMDDAPTDPGARLPGSFEPIGQPLKDSCTTILGLIPDKKETIGHDVHLIPGRNVVFRRGLYETCDPEEQYYLDKRPGLCSEERWSQVYLSAQQQLDKQRMDVEAMKTRLEQERNELLAQVKKSKPAMVGAQ